MPTRLISRTRRRPPNHRRLLSLEKASELINRWIVTRYEELALTDPDVVTASEAGSTDPCPEAEPPNRLLPDPEAPETKDTGAPRGRAKVLTESHKAAHREEKHTPATHSMVGEEPLS